MEFETKIISRQIGDMLYASGLSLGTAESCTGGLISEAIIATPGASNYFKGSVVSYTNEIKERLLKVDHQLLEEKTAVCEEVARQMVQGAMAQMGDPSEFGELPTGEKRDEASVDAESASCVNSRHLYRSRTNRSIAGVCGGIAEFFGIDSTILRLITLFLILFGGLSLWVYIILWIVIPSEPLNCISSKSKNMF